MKTLASTEPAVADPSDRRTVVFVGRRAPAVAAAQALGLDVVCIDEQLPGPRQARSFARFLHHPLTPERIGWEAIAEQAAAGRRIAGVFGLTERSVVPAAYVREHLGLPGDSVQTARLCTDKLEMKRAVAAAGIPCARCIGAEAKLSVDQLIDQLGVPIVFKGRVSSGSRQNRIYEERGQIKRRLRTGWMAESFIHGVEMSVESLVRGGRPVFTNATEYFRVRWANILPAVLEPATLAAALELNLRVIKALGIDTAFTHLEIFLTPAGAVFGEIAARPPGGHITELMERVYGFDPWRAWLQLGCGDALELASAPLQVAGVWVLHPGRGVVRQVSGVEEARAMDGVEKLTLRLRPGTAVPRRVGTGQESGYVVVTGRDRDEVAARLSRVRKRIRIELEPPVE